MASTVVDLSQYLEPDAPIERRLESFCLDPDFGEVYLVGHHNHDAATDIVRRVWGHLGDLVVLPDAGPTVFGRRWIVLDSHSADCDTDPSDPEEASWLAAGGSCLGCDTNEMRVGLPGGHSDEFYVHHVEESRPHAVPVTIVSICYAENRDGYTVIDVHEGPDGVLVLTPVVV
jgi:hypothetical protein